MKKISTLISLGIFLSQPCFAQTLPPTKEGAPLYSGLSNYHRSISTNSQLAQRFFNQGMVLMYGFDYAEAIRSFKAAIQQDPQCAMCYWGLALALGSKSNTPLDGHEREDAIEAIHNAQKYVNPYNASESAYIEALTHRYSTKHAEIHQMEYFSCHGSTQSDANESKAYADAMKSVADRFPNDFDAQSLYAASLFDVTSWNFYYANRNPTPEALEIIRVLERVISKDRNNPFANHYYIHVIEPSKNPEKATHSAEILRDAIPGAEHLVHMPSHIFILTGRYQEALEANLRAIAAFKKANQEAKDQGFEPLVNYLYQHDLHFLWTAAMMQGQSKLALETAREMVKVTPFKLVKQDNLQLFYTLPTFTLARFGMWDDLLNEPAPSGDFTYLQGIWYFGRGMAYANLNKTYDAQKSLSRLREIAGAGPTDSNLGVGGEAQLKIAVAVLAATIADTSNQDEQALFNWRKAVQLQDGVGYREPPSWYYPTREGLAATLMRVNKPQEAEVIYRQILVQYPKYAWALYGLAQSLKAQNKDSSEVENQFKDAWQYADIPKPI